MKRSLAQAEEQHACFASPSLTNWLKRCLSGLGLHVITQKDIATQHQRITQLEQSARSAKQLADDLSASRQQLRMAAEAGGLSLWDWDLQGDRLWISSRWLPIANEQWIEGCGLWDLFTLAHEDDFPTIKKTMRSLLETEAPLINEHFRMMLMGKWRWVNFRGTVSQRGANGQPVRISGTLLDETDRIEAQERARADRDLLQCVIGHIPHAVFWKDAQRRYLGCNRKFAQSLGLSDEQQVIGKRDCELHSSSRIADAIADSDQRVVDSGEEIIAQERSVVSADGTRQELVCSMVPLRTRTGQVFGMLGVIEDITAQKQLQRQLNDARQLESLGRLAAGVAHEINTPMQYISDNVEFLSESTSQVFELIDRVQRQVSALAGEPVSRPRHDTDAATQKQLEYIREQVPRAIEDCLHGSRRVIEIVTAMKHYSHPSNHRFVSANVNELILSTTSITRNRWKHSATVELILAPDLPMIRCLPAEINQVILNLLINAADAVVERYGASSKSQGLITISTQPVSDGIVIEVRDNGCGIPESDMSRVFDPFFTTKEVGKGTGQGLTLSYAIVCNKHGGTLTVESQPGEGTAFRIFLADIPRLSTELPERADKVSNSIRETRTAPVAL